jgi:2-(1,2-epoxy-1,2-dihydrophenyl)acetyl-CoA isomerase
MTLDVRRDGAATWITLDRPETLNALDGPTREALVGSLREAAEDERVRAVALTGSGRAFCVGQDLRELNGVAAGAGVSLALACDLRLASSSARLRLAFSGIALVPDAGSTWHLPRLVGLSRAMEIALLGDWVDADQALQFGLVNRVWPADDLQREAAAAVATLAAGPTLAFARTKALFRDHLRVDLADALAGEATAQVASGQTKDHLEGVTAFLEKRPPTFQGA